MKSRSRLLLSKGTVPAALLALLSILPAGCLHQDTATLDPRQAERLDSVEWRMVSLEANFLEYKEQIKDLEQRVRILESRTAGQMPAPGEEPVMFTEDEVFVQPTPGAPTIAPPAKPSTAQLTAPTGTLYEQGMADYKANRFAQAREKFQSFAASNPSDKLAPNALYWVGETWYSQNNYAQAILSFKEVTRRFPKSSKAPDALLKTAFSYEKLKDLDNAKFYLKALLGEYPKSGAASLAKSKLAALGG